MRSEVVSIAAVDRERLFAIYETHYDGADRQRFFDDLDEKDCVILLIEESRGADVLVRPPRGSAATAAWADEGVRPSKAHETVVGFSTQKVFTFGGVRILFSGDTIIDPRHWGTQELVRAWCRFAGRTKAEAPDTPLYWFLISKGHRTYMYLPLFFARFHPSCDHEPDDFERDLMHRLGNAKFGNRYDFATGLIDERAPLDRLKPEIDSALDRTRNRHVAFFIDRNPHYADGVELLCLTEISTENMRSFARREMERGMAEMLVAR